MENNSKRKGIISILIIAVCLCLCIGATYAYFTDSATSSGNKIQAGKLKIDLELLNKDTLIWNSIKESQDPIFYHEKWEPGYTDVKILKVENEETLAIKWQAKFLYEGQLPALANAIEVYVKTSDSEFAYPTSRDDLDFGWVSQGTLAEFATNISTILKGELLEGESDYFGIALYMPTTVEDNTLQGQSIDPFDIQILATQLSYESDAFDENYDPDATFPNGGVTPPDTTESTEDTSSSEPEPTETEPPEAEPTDTSSGEPTDELEPTDPDLFTWAENGDGTYTVTGLKDRENSPANLVIPSTYNGLPVTKIGDSAFQDCWDIHSVVIPEGVTHIGDWAFADTYISQAVIPSSLISLGFAAFDMCEDLFWGPGAIEYNGGLYIGNDTNPYLIITKVAGYPEDVESFVIHPDTKFIEGAFWGCSSLTSLVIPSGVISIGWISFSGCDSLTNITFEGTTEQWNNIDFETTWGNIWNEDVPATYVQCSDGVVELN